MVYSVAGESGYPVRPDNIASQWFMGSSSSETEGQDQVAGGGSVQY